ncbi:hypothetical protein [Actinobacillus pleuropneumoniae]|uniref:hypothetical protein n=1 Tax=Actinobacillus pleuropneumoniae TaxID=715 RepID=UPI001F38D6AA|nr:hypothetical protein [Actinobacillus pleuropneumoniae]UKH19834.1 hypothetical protein D1109_01110 [Actinobacillus pleuropneumoniae]UKH21693.1 hypothetical protein D1109_11385 [Actinobacillus pleuropneumoniae]UPA21432.1 hypothetical protein JS559_02905 [Actinobacillus pleuropneumoniae]UPA21651.1 hypothetical protein JS559_04090 [Actinobacillus pleuropneumoniae]
MTISTEQWKEIKEALDGIVGRVKFRYKEHQLTVDVVQVKRALELCVYVDGKIDGAWLSETHELRPYLEEVWYRKERSLFSAKQKKEYRGLVSKKQLNQKAVAFVPTFPSPTALIRQYKKLEGLELVKIM